MAGDLTWFSGAELLKLRDEIYEQCGIDTRTYLLSRPIDEFPAGDKYHFPYAIAFRAQLQVETERWLKL